MQQQAFYCINQNLNLHTMTTKKLKRHALLFVLVIISFPLCISAQGSRTDVSGIVRNQDGNILQGVSVIVKISANNFTAATQTDSTGVFNFSRLPSGSGYSFSFSYVDYEAQNLTGYILKPDANLSIVVKLKELNRSLNEVFVSLL